MGNYQNILNSVRNNEATHLLMLNSTKENILNSSITELAEIINTQMDKNPCNYYCNNCGNKGVPLGHCRVQILNWLRS